MAAENTRNTKTDLISVDLLVNNKSLSGEYQLLSLKVERCINKIAKAYIEIKDGIPATGKFDASESDNFIPGKEIEIKAGYHSKTKSIFKGIITSQSIKSNRQGKSTLRLECSDLSIKMTILRKDTFFPKTTDSKAIKKLISENKLTAKVDNTTTEYGELVQYAATDWDFILARAEVNGMIVITDDGTVRVEKPDLSSTPVLQATYGSSIYSFSLDMDAKTQLPSVKTTSWNLSSQKVLQAASTEPTVNKQGNISGKKLSEVFTKDALQTHSTVPLEQKRLKAWADAQLLKSRMAKIRGSLKIEGNEKAKPGTTILLEGLGKRFNGNAYISNVIHDISKGNWTSTVEVGVRADWFADKSNVSETAAAGLLPAISGLQNATVRKIDKDPEKEFRVLVDIPVLKDVKEGIWARLSTLYTTTNKGGTFFYPEIGDEVLIGFLNEDPRFPVILGSMYSKKNAPPVDPDKNSKNAKKMIQTKSKLQIAFDDEKKDLLIITPKGNSLELSESGKKVVLKDQNKNVIELASSGIKMTSKGSITMKATGRILLDGSGINIKAKSTMLLEGASITIKAKLKAAMQAVTTQIKASALAILKGAMVKIN